MIRHLFCRIPVEDFAGGRLGRPAQDPASRQEMPLLCVFDMVSKSYSGAHATYEERNATIQTQWKLTHGDLYRDLKFV